MRRNNKGVRGTETIQESPALLRELMRSMYDELTAIVDYTYGQILWDSTLKMVAELFAATALTEMRHYLTLGRLLRDLGAPFGLRPTPQGYPTTSLQGECNPAVAIQMLQERRRDEEAAARNYQRLSAMATDSTAKAVLSTLARDEEEHAAALAAMAKRLAGS
ncbi:MAG: hypothetical protein IJY50_00205 [Clostridia bacterium]|nr:hypothetical protein [Clostridia bacterium]